MSQIDPYRIEKFLVYGVEESEVVGLDGCPELF